MSALTVVVPAILAALTAFAIGMLAAIAPCALSSGLAAIAYVTSRLSAWAPRCQCWHFRCWPPQE